MPGGVAGEIGEARHIQRRAVLIGQQRRHIFQVRKEEGELACRCRHERVGQRGAFAAADAEGQLPRGLRRKAGDALLQGLVQAQSGQRPQRAQIVHLLRLIGIQLVLCGRRFVGKAGQHLAHAADVVGDVARAVEYLSVVIGQNQVGVAPHDLDDEPTLGQVAQFVQALKTQRQHAIRAQLFGT